MKGKIMDKMRKVLVVDDEEIVRLSHMRTLAGQSCNVEAARGAEEALEKMQREPADVVLMDLRRPGMDGLAGLKTIKERWPETEVVIITGYPSVYTAREAVRLGAFDYLTRSEEHTSEVQSPCNLVCRLLLEKKQTRPRNTLPKLEGDARADPGRPAMMESNCSTVEQRCALVRSTLTNVWPLFFFFF